MSKADDDNVSTFRPPLRNKRVWASVEREVETVVEEALQEALCRDPMQKYFLSKEIVIILDNARYHYLKEVKNYLRSESRIRLVFLPTYSPELNLIERLWKFFKKKVLYNQYYEDLKNFSQA